MLICLMHYISDERDVEKLYRLPIPSGTTTLFFEGTEPGKSLQFTDRPVSTDDQQLFVIVQKLKM